MHTNAWFIDIAFKLIIFSLLAIKIYELMQKYALPMLRRLIDEEKKQQLELMEKDKLISNSQYNMENQLIQQKKMFLALDTKIKQWYDFVKQNQETQDQLKQMLSKNLLKKRTLQEKNYQAMQISKFVIPTAINQAKDELKKIHKTEGNEVLEKLISSLATKKQKGF